VQVTSPYVTAHEGIKLSSAEASFFTTVGFQRFASGLLRKWMPVFRFRSTAVLSLYADVVDVLARDEEFTVSQINAVRTNRDDGPFVLSMDRSAQHDREKAMLNRVVGRSDLAWIRQIVRESANELIAKARPLKRIDVVDGLCRVTPMRLLAVYFGMPGPDEVTMQGWMRSLFYDIFLNVGNDATVSAAAHAAFAQLKPYMDDRIAQRQTEISLLSPERAICADDDLLTRMLLLQRLPEYADWLDNDAIQRNLGGLIIGAVDTTNKASVQSLDQLLRRPNKLKEAITAAEADDVETVRRYAYEALRFNPHNPVLVRYCAQPAIVGAPSGHPVKLAANTTVVVSTLSAMFDPAAFPDPNAFDIGRKTPYLHFGHGLHECQGRHINAVQIPELLTALLRLPGLRRAPGASGQIEFDGPFPNHLILEFD
jgi:cytochrome P450